MRGSRRLQSRAARELESQHSMHEIVERLPAMQTADGDGQEDPWDRYTYCDVLVGGAGTVDQLDHRVGVVDKVDGQSLVGEGITVGSDEGLEVVGDLLSFRVAHAVGGGTLSSPAKGRGGYGCSECNSCEGENGTHVGGRRMVVVGCEAR